MDKIIFDSNIWISFFLEADSNHEKSVELIESANLSKVYLHEYIVLEVVTVLRLRANEKIAAKALNMFEELSLEYVQENIFSNTYLLAKDLKYSKLSFVDLSLLVLSKNYKVITFDKNLEKAIKQVARQAKPIKSKSKSKSKAGKNKTPKNKAN